MLINIIIIGSVILYKIHFTVKHLTIITIHGIPIKIKCMGNHSTFAFKLWRDDK